MMLRFVFFIIILIITPLLLFPEQYIGTLFSGGIAEFTMEPVFTNTTELFFSTLIINAFMHMQIYADQNFFFDMEVGFGEIPLIFLINVFARAYAGIPFYDMFRVAAFAGYQNYILAGNYAGLIEGGIRTTIFNFLFIDISAEYMIVRTDIFNNYFNGLLRCGFGFLTKL